MKAPMVPLVLEENLENKETLDLKDWLDLKEKQDGMDFLVSLVLQVQLPLSPSSLPVNIQM